jgi:hypothetical protein
MYGARGLLIAMVLLLRGGTGSAATPASTNCANR